MIISYAISAVMAFLSALTFVEMAVDYPLAGSSFNYTLAVRPCPFLMASKSSLAVAWCLELPVPSNMFTGRRHIVQWA